MREKKKLQLIYYELRFKCNSRAIHKNHFVSLAKKEEKKEANATIDRGNEFFCALFENFSANAGLPRL